MARDDDDVAMHPKDSWTVKDNFWKDFTTAVRIGVPIVMGGSSKLVQELILSIMLGRRNTVLLAAVSTSVIWTEWVDELVRAGMGQVGVLCGQAFGAGKLDLVSVWLQMGLVLVAVLYPPLALFKVATTPVLFFLGVPMVVAEPAGDFAIWSSFAMVFELWYVAVWSYYVAQSIVAPDAVINFVFIIVTSVLIFFGVYYYDLGIHGAAIALSIKRFLRCVFLVSFCWWMGYHKKTWKGWSWDQVFVRSRWALLLGQCVPAMIGAVAENIQWSINAIFAARLGPTSSAAYDLLITLFLLLYTLVWGLCQGFGLLMARHLGEGKPKRALGIVKVGACLVYSTVLIIATLLYVFFEDYAAFATSDPAVQKQMMKVRVIGPIGIVLCGGLYLISEILNKQGRVGLVFVSLFLSNWFVGLPISFFLTPIWGIEGIFFGVTASYIITHFLLGYRVLMSDWVALSKRARKNAEATVLARGDRDAQRASAERNRGV